VRITCEIDASKSLAKIDLSIRPVFAFTSRVLAVLNQLAKIAITLIEGGAALCGVNECNRLFTTPILGQEAYNGGEPSCSHPGVAI
jgi:hypothetical protein